MVGIGGAGTNVAEHVRGQLGYQVLAINTDMGTINADAFEQLLLIGPFTCNGTKAQTVDQGYKAAIESIEELKLAFSDAKNIVLVAGLGGSTGTGALPVSIKIANSLKINLFVVAILPFDFESKRREIALKALSELQTMGFSVQVHDNAEKMKEMGNQGKSLLDVFSGISQEISSSIQNNI